MPQPETGRIDRIIDIARGVAPAGPGERENREATRVPYSGQAALVQITPSGEKDPPIMLSGENISSGGLCAICRQELPVGSRGAVLLTKSNGEMVILGMRVVYSNAIGPKGFECGLEFELQPSAVTMEDFRDGAGKLPQIAPARAA